MACQNPCLALILYHYPQAKPGRSKIRMPRSYSLDDPPARMEANLADSTNKAGVASVPNEILSAIFEAGCHLPPRPQPSDSSSETDEWEPPFEILVSHVTRHWRNVAVSTPSLWTQIYIAEQHECLDAAAAYLTRSRCLPLDIEVEMGRPHARSRWLPKLPSTCSIIETLTPHVGRCRRRSILHPFRTPS